MKAKFLLPTLVGLSLVACTAEEDFSQNAGLKQSPVTFTVEKDGVALDSRATLDGTVVNFEMGDLISLYHGSPSYTIADGAETPAFTVGNFLAGQNAIYEGEGVDGALTFKTKSMVLEGGAVMVYPADTAFTNAYKSDVKISVPTAQNKSTKFLQPYMSEAFVIGAYDGVTGKNDNTAGYGRNYIVPLKKVGSLLQMTLNPENINMINDIQDVDDVVIESVEIESDDNAFVSSVNVTATAGVPVLSLNKNASGAADNSDDKKYAHLKSVTEVSELKKVASISTEDIANNVAYFTLLPHVSTRNLSTATITVKTSYGEVRVKTTTVDQTEAETYPLVKTGETTHVSLADALENVLNYTWTANTSSKNFKGEKTGGSFKRIFTFDMQNLDMNGANVKTSKQLIDLLKVYSALDNGSAVTWKLAATGNNFLLTGAALDKLIEVNANKTITLDLNSNTITLADADATIAKFQNAAVRLNDNANLILGADLTWTVDQKLAQTNIAKLTNKGTLTVTNNTANYTAALAVELVNAGTMTTGSDKVTLGKFTANAGSAVDVAAGKTLYFAGATGLYGAITNEGIISANPGIVNNYGTIDNKFELSVVESGEGQFNNGGLIKNNGANAVTYLTSNKAIKSGATYYTGIITLTNRDDQISIDADGDKGYIKYTLKDTEADYAPAKGDKFNWLTINKTATVKLSSTALIGGNTYSEGVDYLEITGAPTNIECTEFTVVDLFVEGSMRLLAGNTMTATNIYVKDYILRAAGALTGAQKTTSTPSTYPTPAQAVAYSGEIRTAK